MYQCGDTNVKLFKRLVDFGKYYIPSPTDMGH